METRTIKFPLNYQLKNEFVSSLRKKGRAEPKDDTLLGKVINQAIKPEDEDFDPKNAVLELYSHFIMPIDEAESVVNDWRVKAGLAPIDFKLSEDYKHRIAG